MIWTPTFIASRIIVRLIGRKLSIDLIKSLFEVTFSLIKNIGIFPTFYFLKHIIRYFISNPSATLGSIRVFLKSKSFNPFAINLVFNWLEDYFKELRKLDIFTFCKYSKYFIYLIYLLCIKTFIFKTIRFFCYVILSSVGISWNSFLSDFSFLNWIATKVLDIFSSTLSFFIDWFSIKKVKSITENLSEVRDIDLDIDIDKISYWYITSLIFLGVSFIVTSLVISDYYIPDITRKLPYVSSFLDTLYSFSTNSCKFIGNLWPFNKNPTLPDISPSGGSDITITPGNINDIPITTPRPSPIPLPPLPLPGFNDNFWS